VKNSREAKGVREEINNQKLGSFALCAMLFALCSSVQAQQPKKVYRIGYLSSATATSDSTRFEPIRLALHDLGYIEGQNIASGYRYADEKLDRVPQLAAELVRLKMDVIVTGGATPTRPAKEATTTIPIVMAQDNDPVGNGFVASLARPGGNITGLSTLTPELSGKRLELLKEIVPELSGVAALGTSTNPGNDQALRDDGTRCKGIGHSGSLPGRTGLKDIETAFRDATKGRADAVLGLGSPVLTSQRTQVAILAAKSRLPAILHIPEFAEAGGLMSYGVSITELHRRAATYVDKILKGAKSSELPVEQSTKFELMINLETAKQIGLTGTA
jgi:putative tryptophan/tyrosine transport system substrate-binding protein